LSTLVDKIMARGYGMARAMTFSFRAVFHFRQDLTSCLLISGDLYII